MTREISPYELGVLAGLADRWGDNPYEASGDGYYESREFQQYREGFSLGLRLREIAKAEPCCG